MHTGSEIDAENPKKSAHLIFFLLNSLAQYRLLSNFSEYQHMQFSLNFWSCSERKKKSNIGKYRTVKSKFIYRAKI